MDDRKRDGEFWVTVEEAALEAAVALVFVADYPTDMIRAYEEIAELIASGGGPEAVVGY